MSNKLMLGLLKVQIETECAHCSCPMEIEINNDLRQNSNTPTGLNYSKSAHEKGYPYRSETQRVGTNQLSLP